MLDTILFCSLDLQAFSVARSFIPGKRCMVDKKNWGNLLKHAKSKGGGIGFGISGISNNSDSESYQW